MTKPGKEDLYTLLKIAEVELIYVVKKPYVAEHGRFRALEIR